MSSPIESTLRQRLLKVLRLAQQGVGGERENAQVLLERLLVRHGLTMADLTEAGDPRAIAAFPCADMDEVMISCAMIDALFGQERESAGLVNPLGVECAVTAAEKVALTLALEVFVPAWHEAKADLRVAFIARHRLYDPALDLLASQRAAARSITDEELARRERVNHMMHGLEHVERPGVRLGRGSSGGAS